MNEAESGVKIPGALIGRAEIGLRAAAVGDGAPANVGQNALHVFAVEAQNGRAVERHLVDEFGERRADGFDIGVVVEMFAVDIGHDREEWARA